MGALLVVDAVHFAPHGVIDVQALDPDFLLCSAYKFFGPHIGILYSRKGALDALQTDKVRPQQNTAPEKIETGTLNHAALAGVTAAVDFIAGLSEQSGSLREKIVASMKDIYTYEHELARKLYHSLQEIPGVTVYGPAVADELRAPTVSFTITGISAGEVAKHLGEQGIYVWDGDFYAITVVQQLGLNEQGGLVRVGFAPYNTIDEVERVLAGVRELSGRQQ